MARGEREHAARVHKVRIFWIAFALALLGLPGHRGCALAIAGRPVSGYTGNPDDRRVGVRYSGAGRGLTRSLSSGLLHRMLGIEAMLASRSLASSLRRTSAFGRRAVHRHCHDHPVGITMVGSFRQTVQVWMDDQLKADLFR